MAGRESDTGTTTRQTAITGYFERTIKGEAEEADELSMPIIISDVLKPAQPKIRMALSMTESPQTPRSARTGQQTALSEAEPSQSPSQMRLAVHIRSSPLTPFTPINASASREPSTLPARLGRIRGRPAKSQTPLRPPTPDPLADVGMKAEEPSSGPKKRGRPKGWKPGTPYTTDPNSRYRKREMRAAESQSQAQERNTGQDKGPGQKPEVKRRGRPSRPPEPSIRERYLRSKPEYTPYKCEWELSEDPAKQGSSICPAELQNMDTLRRHVFLVHGDIDPLICRFSHCKDQTLPLKFETDEQFEHHMETKHFAAYLWHMGEGCQNNGIETVKGKSKTLPTYLFDEHGNQVTPSVTDQRLETDLQHKERRRKLRRLLYEQNENAPSEEEWRKQMMGIVVEGQNEV